MKIYIQKSSISYYDPLFIGVLKMFKLNRTEKTNNILFIAIYLFFIASLLLELPDIIRIYTFLIFLYFGATIYGFISKNPIKSYLFGFLIFSSLLIFEFATSIIHSSFFQDMAAVEFRFLLYAVIWGLPGYFAAQRSSDKLKMIFHILFIVLFIVLQFLLLFRSM